MLLLLKVLHLLGLMLGAAGGFGNMAIARHIRRNGPSPALASLRPAFGHMGLIGILLIWVSGILLWLFRYDLVNLGGLWVAKLAVSALLLGVIAVLTIAVRRAQATGNPPPAWVPKLGMTTPVLTLAAVILAAWIFL